MARPKQLRGRPYLGPRDSFNVRVPEAIGDVIRDVAEARGVPFNLVVSEVVAAHFGPLASLDQHDPSCEQLPLSA